jgi:low temperature requirement protein LtrA
VAAQILTPSEERGGLLRPASRRGHRVTATELFFDLVYVFAVTQLSHLLLEHLSVRGALQTLLLLLAVWWAWIYTAWLTNWLDPERRAVRLMLLTLMLLSMIMAASLPEAFHERGLLFAATYAAMQVGRSLFAVVAMAPQPQLRRVFERIVCWSAAAGALWLVGGLLPYGAREVLWVAAVLVDYAGPVVGYVTPGLGRSGPRDWTITGAHLAERCQLFLIIALGESILVTGATFGQLPFSAATIAALGVAFLGSVAFWWLYFDRAAEDSSTVIARADEPGRLGRSAYTYFHLPMVAGIIVAAVGDELVIAHPGGHTDAALAAVVLGGPALFLAGHVLFKRSVFGLMSWHRLAAIAVLASLAPVSLVIPPLDLSAAATLVLWAIAAWDARTYPHTPGAVGVADGATG